MDAALAQDLRNLHALLLEALETAHEHLSALNDSAPVTEKPSPDSLHLPAVGLGASDALRLFRQRVGAMAATSGPRYWGFVTGGTTPAALMGDWLVSAYDMNAIEKDHSAAPVIEAEAAALMRELLGLPGDFHGVFVSGATLSNFVGLALAREWVGKKLGVSVAQEGLYRLPSFKVFSASPHSSAVKALAMLGMGRAFHPIAKLEGSREAADTADLERHLAALNREPCIVIANSGTVNTTDFDDLAAIAALKQRYPFWLHVDAAFGAYAACSPRYSDLLHGVEHADSLTVDAHKWLNVPYDCGIIFTRHPKLQSVVFQNAASYLPDPGNDPAFLHLTPESSRRFRALPVWLTLVAYGKEGYQHIVESNCDIARLLAGRITASSHFALLAPTRLNIVCFALRAALDDPHSAYSATQAFLDRLRRSGQVYMTPTVYNGIPAIRAAFSNWRTTAEDVETAWSAMMDAVML